MSGIGLKIKELRKSKNWSMDRLGEEIGKTSSSVNGYEKGKNEPPLDIIVKISKIFNVTVDELMSGGELSAKYDESKVTTKGDGNEYASLQAIADQSKYSREDQKAHIRMILMNSSSLDESEKVELLKNEYLIQQEIINKLNEVINTSMIDEIKDALKRKLGKK